MLYAVVAILIFGLLIAVHELGHFLTAKLSGVRVNEFAIGMGPVLLQRQRGETLYSLRALPIGGYCAMEGEDEASQDPKAFGSQGFWKKVLILAAGSAMNFLAGLVLILFLLGQNTAFYVPVVGELYDGFPLEGEQGLMVGDQIRSINGNRIYTWSDLTLFLEREQGAPMDLVVERNGQRLTLNDLPLEKREYLVNGEVQHKFGIVPAWETATLFVQLRETVYTAIDFVRMVWMGLGDLLSGSASLQDMTGPIGIVGTVTEAGQSAEAAGGLAAGMRSVVYFLAFIAVNLAVMNLLPVPALDGGRIFLLVVSTLFTKLTGKTLDPKYEGFIHTVGFIALLALMVVVAFNDIFRLLR